MISKLRNISKPQTIIEEPQNDFFFIVTLDIFQLEHNTDAVSLHSFLKSLLFAYSNAYGKSEWFEYLSVSRLYHYKIPFFYIKTHTPDSKLFSPTLYKYLKCINHLNDDKLDIRIKSINKLNKEPGNFFEYNTFNALISEIPLFSYNFTIPQRANSYYDKHIYQVLFTLPNPCNITYAALIDKLIMLRRSLHDSAFHDIQEIFINGLKNQTLMFDVHVTASSIDTDSLKHIIMMLLNSLNVATFTLPYEITYRALPKP